MKQTVYENTLTPPPSPEFGSVGIDNFLLQVLLLQNQDINMAICVKLSQFINPFEVIHVFQAYLI